jgi:hypothetical protein
MTSPSLVVGIEPKSHILNSGLGTFAMILHILRADQSRPAEVGQISGLAEMFRSALLILNLLADLQRI